MLLKSPPPSQFTYVPSSPLRPRRLSATFSDTHSQRIPRRRSAVYPPGFDIMKPRLVTATSTSPDEIERSSPIYQFSESTTYFEQCFKIVRHLGKGVFGEVLDVQCLEDGKRYAIKRALRTFGSSGDRHMKLREVLLHESIPAHPNIVGFKKAWEERGRLYIQTELCGPNLAEYRRQIGILNGEELITVSEDMCKALQHIHSIGLLHMDVKPSNIFISAGTLCKLGDFGLAFSLNEDPADCAEEGDKFYMAPEILNNPPTPAADIFSLGVTLLELSTDIDLEKDKEVIRSGNLPKELFGELTTDLVDVITSMLDPNPITRPSASELVDVLRVIHRPRHATVFKEVEVYDTSQHVPDEDSDWDSHSLEIFPSCITPVRREGKSIRKLSGDRLIGFSRRLNFEEEEADETKCLKRRRLFDK